MFLDFDRECGIECLCIKGVCGEPQFGEVCADCIFYWLRSIDNGLIVVLLLECADYLEPLFGIVLSSFEYDLISFLLFFSPVQ